MPAKKPAKKKAAKKKAPARKRKSKTKAKAEPESAGLTPTEMAATPPAAVTALADAIAGDGGAVLAPYRDPLGGTWLVLAALPISRVHPTAFQRDLSEAHMKRLTAVVEKLGRFLDPVIAVRTGDGEYQTPNGHHRLGAMRSLGAKSITALVVPETEVAYKILALNTEKAHNLREKCLEVIRMYRELVSLDGFNTRTESEFALEFEEPAFCTLGACYEQNGRFGGGAYNPILKRCEEFLPKPVADALATREARAEALLAVDARVGEIVKALKAQGLDSPYLRNFVVARLNPLRFKRGASMPVDDCIAKMAAAAAKFDPGKIRPQDVARSGGGGSE